MDQPQISNEAAHGSENPPPPQSDSDGEPPRHAESRKHADSGRKKSKRDDRRILTRPDGVISEIEDTTYAILRKHEK